MRKILILLAASAAILGGTASAQEAPNVALSSFQLTARYAVPIHVGGVYTGWVRYLLDYRLADVSTACFVPSAVSAGMLYLRAECTRPASIGGVYVGR